jgi:hypothetical protein
VLRLRQGKLSCILDAFEVVLSLGAIDPAELVMQISFGETGKSLRVDRIACQVNGDLFLEASLSLHSHRHCSKRFLH